MQRSCLDTLRHLVAEKRPAALVTDLSDGDQCVVSEGETVAGALPVPPELIDAVAEQQRKDQSRRVAVGDKDFFIQIENPPLRLIIIGAVHIAQFLAPMAQLAGYDVILVDPRRAFADADRFGNVTIVDEWPDDALVELKPDQRTAIVTLTHDPKLDDAALEIACASPCFYIASLGSKRTHAKRRDRLLAAGVTEAGFGRIHGPAGLPLGAVSPAEIALSVMAQMTARLRGAAPL